MKNLKEWMKKVIIGKLYDYEGSRAYSCELAYTLFEGENIDGSYFYNTYETKEWIKENFTELGEVVEIIIDNLGAEFIPNCFLKPEKFMVVCILEFAQNLLSQCNFIEENWNNEIELSMENIEKIIDELNII